MPQSEIDKPLYTRTNVLACKEVEGLLKYVDALKIKLATIDKNEYKSELDLPMAKVILCVYWNWKIPTEYIDVYIKLVRHFQQFLHNPKDKRAPIIKLFESQQQPRIVEIFLNILIKVRKNNLRYHWNLREYIFKHGI